MASKRFNRSFVMAVLLVFIMVAVLLISGLFYINMLSENSMFNAKVVYDTGTYANQNNSISNSNVSNGQQYPQPLIQNTAEQP